MDRPKTSLKAACKKIKDLDFYADSLTLTFKEQTHYTTWIGAFFSTLMFILFAGFASMKTLKLVSREDPFLSTHTGPRDDTFAADLKKLDYFFAVQQLDPRAGQIEVRHTEWGAGKDKIITPIELVDCTEMYKSKERDEFSKSELAVLDSVAFDR